MEKKLRLIGWVASFFSLLGVFFNAYRLPICWPIWCFGNIFWIYWAYKKKEWAQVILWIVFTIANLYGWYQWTKI